MLCDATDPQGYVRLANDGGEARIGSLSIAELERARRRAPQPTAKRGVTRSGPPSADRKLPADRARTIEAWQVEPPIVTK